MITFNITIPTMLNNGIMFTSFQGRPTMIFTYNCKLGLADINDDNSARLTTLLKMMENGACYHSDSAGRRVDNYCKTGQAWALLDWQIEIISLPLYGQDIRIDTWSRKVTKTYAYRDFEVFADGELCVKASSRWFLIDMNKRRPVRITEAEVASYDPEDRSTLGIDEMEKLMPLDSFDDTCSYTVRKCEVDLIGHMHNVNYIDIINECLDNETMKNFRHIRINYRKEIKAGDTVIAKKKNPISTGGEYLFSIDSEDGTEIHALARLS